MLKKLFRNIINAKLVMIIGFAIAVSLVISQGAEIQEVFLAFFDLDSPTIYKSIYGDCIRRLPNLAIWLKQAFHPTFLFVSFVIAMTAFKMPSFRKFFFAVWVASAIGLSGIDVVYASLGKSLTVSYLTENLASNIIGSLVLAIVFAVIISLSENIFQLSDARKIWKHVTCAIGVVSIGVAISAFIYLILGMFLHPVHVDARISTTLPVTGTIATQNSNIPHTHPVSVTTKIKKSSTSETIKDDPFMLIPKNAELRKLKLIGHDNSEFRWMNMQDDTTFSLSLYAISGCVNDFELDDALSEKAIYFQENVRDVKFQGDGDMQQILIEGQQSDVVVSNEEVTQFTIKQGATESSLDIHQSLNGNANVQAKTSGDISIKLTRWVVEQDEKKINFVQRSFSLYINDKLKQIRFVPMTHISDDVDTECKTFLNEHTTSEYLQFNTQLVAGIFVRIQRTDEPDGYITDYDGQYELVNPNGWIITPEVEVDYFSRSHTGKINSVQLKGPIGEIEVDNKTQELSQSQWFQGFGNLTASYFEDGKLSINGEYCTAWIDGKRLNPTRWENFLIEFKIALCSVIFTVLIWLILFFLKLWREDQILSWAKNNAS